MAMGQQSGRQFSSGAIILRDNCPWGNYPGGNNAVDNYPGGSFPWRQLSQNYIEDMSVLDLASVNTSNVQEMYPTPSI